ncbi:MAG: UbiA family prenyltransferase [Polyangiales bacterium]
MVLLFHLWLPVLTAFSLSRVVAQTFPHAVFYPAGAWSLYLGVLVVYTGDRLVERGRVPKAMHKPLWAVIGAALLVMGYLALREPWRLLPVEAALGLISVAYGAIKGGPLLKTTMVTLTWWVGCTLLPFHLTGEPELHPELLFHPAVIGFAIMIAPSTLLCDFKDEESDRQAGVRSLPILLGPRGAQLVCAALATLGMIVAASASGWATAVTAFFMLAVTPFLRLLRRPLMGPLTVDSLLTLPGLYPWL